MGEVLGRRHSTLKFPQRIGVAPASTRGSLELEYRLKSLTGPRSAPILEAWLLEALTPLKCWEGALGGPGPRSLAQQGATPRKGQGGL